MINIKKLTSQFEKLTPEQKKQKLLAMIDVVKTEGDLFSKLGVIISAIELENQFLNDSYKLFIRMMYSSEANALYATQKKQSDKLKKIASQEKHATSDKNLESLLTTI
ncbi:MAG TPA: hypothetical protein PKD96_03550 [Candidatus Absconditabacterales bacterium]|nr:hypothetical protein [Candidatus Absconditabacterales bacterium]HMT27354.1 hypothetical protein [Candidatus Absconditabacterales bacterium]